MKRILWFRRDLRIEDNPLLSLEGEVLPIFIFDPDILSSLENNDRRVTIIYNALLNLKSSLQIRGLDLALFYGKPVDVFKWILSRHKFDEVCASGDYDPYALERDREVSHLLAFNYIHDTYIFRPDEILKNDGTPYLVFTPFYNRAKSFFSPEHMKECFPAKQQLSEFDYTSLYCIRSSDHSLMSVKLESIGFIPQKLSPEQQSTPAQKLDIFAAKIGQYTQNRDYMALHATSGLSTDLRFGTVSIRAVLRWILVQKREGIDTEPFFRQLIFREFYAMLFYHFPYLCKQNFRYPFEGVANEEYFQVFCTAQTGVPIVDAGIRELLECGEMHNRVRMICASFFTKNLLLPWQWGEAFFARHLNDYDTASNILSWQWSAGTGVDPQPYFRIFNPYKQSLKFDPSGEYIYQWIPQLTHLPPQYLSEENTLRLSDIDGYPKSIVEYKQSSQNALHYFKHSLT